MTRLADRLPDFPWTRLAPYKAIAEAHPEGLVDLSIGTPVDTVPGIVQAALAEHTNTPGYPLTAGSSQLREAASAWAARTLHAAVAPDAILPTVGSKELVALLPTLLGLGPDDTVVIPELAYPTYDVGARVAGCQVVVTDSTHALGPQRVSLVWVNSPSNPTGQVLPAEHLAKIVAWARERDAVVVSDECYLELAWDATPVSILDERVCGASHDNLLAVHSLSKRSNLAGYRAGLVLGDQSLITALLEARKNLGLMVPAPVQAAAAVALGDDLHVAEQRHRYSRRRDHLLSALLDAGLSIEHSEAGLYLWATRGEACWDTVAWLAGHGILVAPGDFYGAAGAKHVRVAVTATDERIASAVRRLARAA